VLIDEESGSTAMGVVLMDVGRLRIALPVMSVREVLPLPALSPFAGMPPLIAGTFSLGGDAVLVLRLDRLLDIPEIEPGAYAKIVLLKSRGQLALLATEVRDIRIVDGTMVSPVRAVESFNGCTIAEIALPDGPVALLSPQRLLAERERRTLGDFEAMAKRRLEALAMPAESGIPAS